MGGETNDRVSGWTVDTLREQMLREIDNLSQKLDERYGTQTKAVDAAFLAQQTAMQTALTAAERAVQTALLAAEKAVIKAETAADKRFEAVNEFRAQLADQANTFMPRVEAEAAIARNRERNVELALQAQGFVTRAELDAHSQAAIARYQELANRVNTSEGRSGGINASWGILVSMIGAVGVVVAIVIALAK